MSMMVWLIFESLACQTYFEYDDSWFEYDAISYNAMPSEWDMLLWNFEIVLKGCVNCILSLEMNAHLNDNVSRMSC